MRFLVIGAGGVGGYVGARLKAAGQDVQFVARGEHGRALAEGGLLIRGSNGDERIPVGTPLEARALTGQYDVVLLAVKWAGLPDACDELQRVLTPDGVVLPLLNGLSSEDVVASYVGAQRTLASVAYMSAGLLGPGEIYVHGNSRLGLAAYRPGQDSMLELLPRLFQAAGIPVRVHGDYRAMLWEKMVWNAPFNAICALARKPSGAVVEAQSQLVRDAMLEVIRVARADGVNIADAMADVMLQVTRSEYAKTEPSMLQDLRAGRSTEVDILQGAVAERAAQLGVEAPIMKTLAGLIRAAQG
jgi:2-dehydropantoate 2-reductase